MRVVSAPPEPASEVRVVVPTMGALHDGHTALIRQARECAGPAGEVVVTIFVNPTQFGPGEDFARYPRTFEADLQACESAGADLVYAPSGETVYGSRDAGDRVTVQPGPLGDVLEGAHRPGHFAAVLTVVSILLSQVRASSAVFGEKDFQQLVLIRRMCQDLSMGVDIVGVPTVRDSDGLALSSRNAYLSADERTQALAIWRALQAGAENAPAGEPAVVEAARSVIDNAGLALDYLEVRGEDLDPAPRIGAARLLVAARVGKTRLLDNIPLTLGGGSDV